MSRTGINYLDVASAAAKVQGRNENPTVDRIREILGTGSKSTIARHLKEWKTNNGDLASTSGLPEELVSVVTGLWERLQREADQEILDYQSIVDDKLQDMDTDLNEAQKKNLELQQQNHILEEALFKSNEHNKNNDQLLKDECLTTAKQQAYIANLENQLNMQKQENTKIHLLLNNIQKNLEHYQDSMQQLQQEQSLALDKQKNHFEQEIAILRNKLSEAVKIECDLKANNQQLKQQLAQFEQIKIQNQALEFSCKEKDAKLIILHEDYKKSLYVNEKHVNDIETKNKSIIDLEQKAAIANSRIHDLEQILQKLEDKIAKLRQEQIFMVQEKSRLEGRFKQLTMHQLEVGQGAT